MEISKKMEEIEKKKSVFRPEPASGLISKVLPSRLMP